MRYRAATMGRATPVRHRSSHIYVEIDKVAQEKKKKPVAGKNKKEEKSGE